MRKSLFLFACLLGAGAWIFAETQSDATAAAAPNCCASMLAPAATATAASEQAAPVQAAELPARPMMACPAFPANKGKGQAALMRPAAKASCCATGPQATSAEVPVATAAEQSTALPTMASASCCAGPSQAKPAAMAGKRAGGCNGCAARAEQVAKTKVCGECARSQKS